MIEKLKELLHRRVLSWYVQKFLGHPDFEELFTAFDPQTNMLRIIDPKNPTHPREVWDEMWDDLMAVKLKKRLVGYLEKRIILLVKEMTFDSAKDTEVKRSHLLCLLHLKQQIEFAIRVEEEEKRH